MPYSSDIFDSRVKQIIEASNYLSFLDIGCGEGKYHRLIKDVKPQASIMGIEAHEPYVKQFKLQQKYDDLIVADAHRHLLSQPNFTTECAILGDVIEHMPKSQGIDVINYLVYRTKLILVIYPHRYVQFAHGRTPAIEAHISVWCKDDFAAFDYIYEEDEFMRLVAIKGYQ